MTRLTRRLLFYSLVLIFILATPPTILYATGYSFDWQKKAITATGGFYLKSLPEEATILIDGQNKKTTPRLVSRLLPKSYSVEIAKEGFHSWQKELTIEPKLVTEARNIILFPNTLLPEKISDNVTSTIPEWLTPSAEKQSYLQAQNIASSSAAWLNKGPDIFYLDKTSLILYRQDFGGFIKEQLAKEPLPKNTYKLSASNNNRFLALDSNGSLFLLNQSNGIFEQVFSQVKEAQFSSDNKKILIQTNNEVWILYIEDFLLQPYKKTGDKELVARFSQPISQAIFYPDNEHVAFVIGNQIKITELDDRSQRNTVDFISAANPKIYFDGTNSSFYYLAQKELWRIKLEF
ncbi:MAG TPA: PEGA domain-containing protein [Candidatus Portnoybacteria bacterium]|nr:PEGA domain-containing protein [Candidatus Portnoybacteria bacterium]